MTQGQEVGSLFRRFDAQDAIVMALEQGLEDMPLGGGVLHNQQGALSAHVPHLFALDRECGPADRFAWAAFFP